MEIAGVAAFLMLLVLLPQTFFVFQLIRAKRKGRHEYHLQAMHYVNEFRGKWLAGMNDPKEPFLGSGDGQSLANCRTASTWFMTCGCCRSANTSSSDWLS
jgi:hypothetical protein